MKITAIIQARTGSTRLPNKVMEVLCGRTVLSHVISRVKACAGIDEIVVATTLSRADSVIVEEARRNGVEWFRGSESDVLGRYFGAANKFGADAVIRITSDCPLLDPSLLGRMREEYVRRASSEAPVDYLSNGLVRTFPRGLDCEIFSFAALDRAHREARKPYEREHVTPYIYEHPDIFSLFSFEGDTDLSEHRWTLDTREDLQLISEIFNHLYQDGAIFSTAQVLALLVDKPHLKLINAGVKQKGLDR